MRPAGAVLSKATLGKVRRMLVARLSPEVLNPFARSPEHDALLRSTLAEICADPELDLAPSPAVLAEIEAEICGLGALQPLVDDPEVADILVNAPDAIFVERSGRLEQTAVRLSGTRELIDLAERIAALAGRELSVAHPVVDARMPDGSRVNAVIPPVGGPYLSIRKFNRLRLDLVPGGHHGRSWVEADGMSAELADFLIAMVRARANLLVAGETGAGKTTLLRSLTDAFAPDERVGVVEDTAELALENANRFNLETLHPTDLAHGEADARLLDVGDLVANALRMRPDRLIVGEIRLPKEAFYTLQALHTGHDGSATTIHASSAEDALFRLELLARQSMRDLSAADLRAYIARVFDLVVVLRRLRNGRRIAHQVAALDGLSAAGYRLTDVFRAVPDGADHLRWRRDPDWRPPERLRAQLQDQDAVICIETDEATQHLPVMSQKLLAYRRALAERSGWHVLFVVPSLARLRWLRRRATTIPQLRNWTTGWLVDLAVLRRLGQMAPLQPIAGDKPVTALSVILSDPRRRECGTPVGSPEWLELLASGGGEELGGELE